MERKETLSVFNDYIQIEIPYIDAEKVRLCVKPATAASLVAKLGDPATPAPDTWRNLWTLHMDDTTNTREVNVKLTSLQDEIYNLLLSAYGDIPPNVWTDTDRIKLHRKTGTRAQRTTVFPKIDEDCHVRLTADGGGELGLGCYTTEDESRASKPENAEGVEIAYRIDVPIVDKVEGQVETSGIVRHYELKDANDNTIKHYSTKAKFIMSLGTENIGHYFQCYARWYNAKHPEINGRWTGPFGKTIS